MALSNGNVSPSQGNYQVGQRRHFSEVSRTVGIKAHVAAKLQQALDDRRERGLELEKRIAEEKRQRNLIIYGCENPTHAQMIDALQPRGDRTFKLKPLQRYPSKKYQTSDDAGLANEVNDTSATRTVTPSESNKVTLEKLESTKPVEKPKTPPRDIERDMAHIIDPFNKLVRWPLNTLCRRLKAKEITPVAAREEFAGIKREYDKTMKPHGSRIQAYLKTHARNGQVVDEFRLYISDPINWIEGTLGIKH